MYSVFVRDWLAIFPRNQLLIIKSEDYYHNTEASLGTIFDFLEVQRPDDYRKYVKHSVRNKGCTTKDMLPKTRVLLNQLYQPMKDTLAAMLNDKRFLWLSN